MPNWSKAGYSSFDDCVAKNQDKGNPQAYCGEIRKQLECPSEVFENDRPPKAWFDDCVSSVSGEADNPEALCNWIWHHMHERLHEAYRHRDFTRIYDEFVNYYKDPLKGESEYYKWLKALNLDEQHEYAQAAESFRWAKDMIHFLREDADNKYYKVLVGFPLESMNGNVYHERDLIAAALSVKGKYPSLNHHDKYWFSPKNPRNRWGNILVVGAKYEDGAVEAIIQVPKGMPCPICDGAPMTELIDKQRIVNVSLEGTCAVGDIMGNCEGFQFGDPPFTLLTTDVLPGIPLARIKPLEHIMVEALHANETTRRRRKVRIKLVPKEQDEEPRDQQCADDEVYDNATGKCVKKPKTAGEDAIEPGSQYCKDHPDDPRCKAHKTAIHGEQVALEPEDCPEGEIWDPRAGQCVKPETAEQADLDTPRTSTQRVSPNVMQGQYPALGTISHTDPSTAVGDSPGTVRAFPKEASEPDSVTHDTEPGADPHERPMPRPELEEPTSKDTKVEPVHPGVTDAGTSYVAPESPPTLPTPTPVPEAPLDQAGKELGKTQEPHTCADGYHYDYDADMCIPDEPITEMVRRIKAEAKLVEREKGRKAFEDFYILKLTTERGVANRLRTKCAVLEESLAKTDKAYRDAYKAYAVEYQNHKIQRRLHDDAQDRLIEKDHIINRYKRENLALHKKYNTAMELAQRKADEATKGNIEYMELHKKYEASEEARKRMRNLNKKAIRIKA